jgi:CRISPR-associated protein Csm3
MELIYNVFDDQDKEFLKQVFIAMELLEHDYLGGMGSRGYGRVAFNNIEVFWNKREDYENGKIALIPERAINKDLGTTPAEIVQKFEELKKRLAG